MPEQPSLLANLSPHDRAEAYRESVCGKKWLDSIPWVGLDGKLYAIWILGQDYRNKSPLHGAYPPNYLTRVYALYPELAVLNYTQVLHLFSGSLEPGNYIRFDAHPERPGDVTGDAHDLRKHFNKEQFDIVFADPPYTEKDQAIYMKNMQSPLPMVNRKRVLHECAYVMKKGAHLVWVDEIFPMHQKAELKLVGTINIIRSTNHRTRNVFIFERQ